MTIELRHGNDTKLLDTLIVVIANIVEIMLLKEKRITELSYPVPQIEQVPKPHFFTKALSFYKYWFWKGLLYSSSLF
jgi:hypothetical protein